MQAAFRCRTNGVSCLIQLAQLSARDPRDALCQLKCKLYINMTASTDVCLDRFF